MLEVLEVLDAHGPYPSSRAKARKLRWRRVHRAAWEAYLDAADACGLLTDDMVEALRSWDADQFRGALGEARICFYLAGKRRYRVEPRPPGRGTRVLDMHVKAPNTDFNVEVKAPFIGHHSLEYKIPELLVSKLEAANQQFDVGACNVLALAPDFTWKLVNDRLVLVKAFIGQPMYIVPIQLDDDVPVPEPYDAFKIDGRLARRGFRDGQYLKPNFTRVSAVLSIEDGVKELTPYEFDLDAPLEIQHHVLVLHNPHAAVPLPESVFAGVPQLVLRGERMVWTDREHRVDVGLSAAEDDGD
jgi:hypothetical protein